MTPLPPPARDRGADPRHHRPRHRARADARDLRADRDGRRRRRPAGARASRGSRRSGSTSATSRSARRWRCSTSGRGRRWPIRRSRPRRRATTTSTTALEALLDGARRLAYPMLCANVDVGLPATALLETPAGPLGAIGLAHPEGHRFTAGAAGRRRLARARRRTRQRAAARGRALGGRAPARRRHLVAERRLDRDPIRPPGRARRPVGAGVDAIVGGHNFGAWTGTLAGTPAGEANVFAASVLVIDLPAPPAPGASAASFRTPPVTAAPTTPAVAAFDAAAAPRRGQQRAALDHPHRRGPLPPRPDRPGLPREQRRRRRVRATRPPRHAGAARRRHGASCRQGPVTELDLIRIFPADDYGPVIVELEPGELRAAGRAPRRDRRPAEPCGRRVVVELVPHARPHERRDRGREQRRGRHRQREPSHRTGSNASWRRTVAHPARATLVSRVASSRTHSGPDRRGWVRRRFQRILGVRAGSPAAARRGETPGRRPRAPSPDASRRRTGAAARRSSAPGSAARRGSSRARRRSGGRPCARAWRRSRCRGGGRPRACRRSPWPASA